MKIFMYRSVDLSDGGETVHYHIGQEYEIAEAVLLRFPEDSFELMDETDPADFARNAAYDAAVDLAFDADLDIDDDWGLPGEPE